MWGEWDWGNCVCRVFSVLCSDLLFFEGFRFWFRIGWSVHLSLFWDFVCTRNQLVSKERQRKDREREREIECESTHTHLESDPRLVALFSDTVSIRIACVCAYFYV